MICSHLAALWKEKKKKKGRGNSVLYYSHFVNEVNMGVFEFKISQ